MYIFESHLEPFMYIYIYIVLLWSLVINKRCITLETARDLKAVILPSKVNCLMRHDFKMFFILTKYFQRFLSCSGFLSYEKRTLSIFTVSLLNLTNFITQSAT